MSYPIEEPEVILGVDTHLGRIGNLYAPFLPCGSGRPEQRQRPRRCARRQTQMREYPDDHGGLLDACPERVEGAAIIFKSPPQCAQCSTSWIIFTSDRSGNPQIYRMPVTGGAPERLTFDGNYNVTPRYAPDGKSFVFIQRNGGRFNVALQDFVSKQTQLLTENGVDESPSFAPNGRIVLYASEIRGRVY